MHNIYDYRVYFPALNQLTLKRREIYFDNHIFIYFIYIEYKESIFIFEKYAINHVKRLRLFNNTNMIYKL